MPDGVIECFEYYPPFRVVICTRCQGGIPNPGLQAHLKRFHPDLLSSRRQAVLQYFTDEVSLAPSEDLLSLLPRHLDAPIPNIPIFEDGLRCRQCDSTPPRPYIGRSEENLRRHCQSAHKYYKYRGRGRPSTASARNRRSESDPWHCGVRCQRLFTAGLGSFFLEIIQPTTTAAAAAAATTAPPLADNPPGIPAEVEIGAETGYTARIQQRVRTQLQTIATEQQQQQQQDHLGILAPADRTEANPWLRITRWAEFLEGYELRKILPLVDPPRPTETILREFSRSLDRIIEEARASVLTERINIFDQTMINMFTDHATKAGRPLATQLREGTYRQYKNVWKRLLCFVYRCFLYRTADPDVWTAITAVEDIDSDGISRDEANPTFPFILTRNQYTGLRRSIREAYTLVGLQGREGVALEALHERRQRLDRVLARLCMALLEHILPQSIYQSTVIGFLAILGIDEKQVRSERLYRPPPSALLIQLDRVASTTPVVIPQPSPPSLKSPSSLLFRRASTPKRAGRWSTPPICFGRTAPAACFGTAIRRSAGSLPYAPRVDGSGIIQRAPALSHGRMIGLVSPLKILP